MTCTSNPLEYFEQQRIKDVDMKFGFDNDITNNNNN